MAGDDASRYALKPVSIKLEDILFCVDVDVDSTVKMKTAGTDGTPLTRLDCVKQAFTLFIHNKLSVNPDHRFAFATLSKSAAWLKKEFTNDAESAVASIKGLSATKSSGPADLTLLFQEAAKRAVTSKTQNRILRVILIYCRSSMRPTNCWPLNQKLFTLDVMYLHDKPGPDNCPQDVFDSLAYLVDNVSEYEGYMFETARGVVQSVFMRMSKLLSHPQQRCAQADLPESPAKKAPATKPAGSPDKSALNSKKEVKQPLGETSNTNRKRLHRLGEEKAPVPKNYDENLVGSRIEVWWPLDRKYYKGVVKSYDSAKKKHLVYYDDGDKELLEMRKHKWLFLKKSSEHAGANPTGCSVEPSTMPQKKKIKTSKEQSTNKQLKMDIRSETLSPIPCYAKKEEGVPQVSMRQADQVLSSCASQNKKHLIEPVKSSSVSMDKHTNVVNSTCGGAFNSVKPEEVANKKEDCQGPREEAVKEKQKAVEVSAPEQTCVLKRILNVEHSSLPLPPDSSVNAAATSINKNGHETVSLRRGNVVEAEVKTQRMKRTLEMVKPPLAEEEDPGETETRAHKRVRVEICNLRKAHDEMEKTAAEREPSCLSNMSIAEPGDLQCQKISEPPCSVIQQLANVKQSILESLTTVRQCRSELEMKEQSILDAITTVRQCRSELEIKEQSIADTLSSVRKFRSEMKNKEDTLEAKLLDFDVLGEKILGISKILNS